jgi:hypothetical protein
MDSIYDRLKAGKFVTVKASNGMVRIFRPEQAFGMVLGYSLLEKNGRVVRGWKRKMFQGRQEFELMTSDLLIVEDA